MSARYTRPPGRFRRTAAGLALGAALGVAFLAGPPGHATDRTAARTVAGTVARTAPPSRCPVRGGWVGSWEAAPAYGAVGTRDVASGDTLRQVVHLSVGGSAVRVRLSNRFGTSPLPLGHVTVAVEAPGPPEGGVAPAPVPVPAAGTLREVTFHGSGGAVVGVGADLTSDAVRLPVRAGTNLLVSTYLPEVAGPVTTHPEGLRTSFYAPGGDRAAEPSGAAFTGTTTQWHYLTGVDVLESPAAGAVVALGDSITDGNRSTTNADDRWPDVLADRLAGRVGVLNAGISGNRLLLDGGSMGVRAPDRLGEDVFSRAGVCTVVLLEGINDIQQSPHQLDPAAIDAAYRRIVAEAHARGVRVIGATLLPFEGFVAWSPALERTREAVNDYIRTSGTFDAVIDFDQVMRDPADPLRIRPEYDSGDHLHPNDAGYRAMADAVPLGLLAPRG